MLPKAYSRNLLAAALLTAMACVWVVLAPAQFGGQAAYVMVAGASMEPTLHQGDLVVVREAQTYAVGDIATYRHPSVGPVIHRIIDRHGDRFVFQGDNNDWLDSYAPTANEVVGKAWLVLPGGATLLRQLRSPAGLAFLSVSLALILLITVRNGRGEKSHSMTSKRSASPPQSDRRLEALDGPVFVLAAVGLGALVLAIIAFARPALVSTPDDVPYAHLATFSYHAGGPASVYAGGEIRSGDPVFHQIVPRFQIEFVYHLQSPATGALAGSAGMVLEISEPNGWRRTLVLQPESPVSGRDLTLTGVVDLNLVRQAIALLEARTALDRQAYSVDIIPWVRLEGDLGGEPFSDTFQPRLAFTVDDLELYLRQGDPLSDIDPLRPTASGFVAHSTLTPAALSILGLDLTVVAARWIGTIAALLCLAGIATLSAPVLRAYRAGGFERTRVEYAARMIDVKAAPPAKAKSMIEVVAFEDLARLAEKNGRMILHVSDGGEHHFYVDDAGTTYHLAAGERTERKPRTRRA